MKDDPVNSPAHYKIGGLEVIDVIEAWLTPEQARGFRIGSAIKYIARAGRKDPSKYTEDLSKARWFLDREIAKADK